MKNFNAIILCLILPLMTMAQTNTKPQKLRYTSGFLSGQYELGDKDITENEVGLHLEKNLPSAYTDFEKGRSLEKSSLLWNLVGLSGLITGISSDDPTLQLLGYGVGAVSFTFAFVNLSKGSKKKSKALKDYNQHFGY